MNEKLKLSLKVSGIALAVGQAGSPTAMAQTAEPSVVVVTGTRASAQSSVAMDPGSLGRPPLR
jgi:hypothetical protein